jgi:multiple sugar transport system substrate-binding protein
MRKILAWLVFVLGTAAVLTLAANAALTDRLIFLSTQLRPIAEAQKMRNLILKDFAREVEFITEPPQGLQVRLKAGSASDATAIDVIGALHGELQPLALLDVLVPLDDLAKKASDRGIPDTLLALGKFDTAHQLYIPWMQAGYIMVANKDALPYLPPQAEIDALSYDQLAAWAETIQQKTGKRLLGFPAGSRGLMHRFLEGFLYPSFTGGVVRPFRGMEAEAMWTGFASLWKSVNPNTLSYNFMAQPLLSGEVWIGFDHIARVLDALRQKPDQFVAFPAPSGPRGRGYMPVLAGLAVPRAAHDMDGAMALIDYLSQLDIQLVTARSAGFFPTLKADLSTDPDRGLKMGAAALFKAQSASDALPALPPIGLGERDAEFDKVFMDTFHLIVLRGHNPRVVLDQEAEVLRRLMAEVGAPCWEPDPPGVGACHVQ